MKNFLALTTILSVFMCSNVTLAQSDTNNGFGIKGGLNYATVTKGNFDDGPAARTSFYLGIMGEIPIVDGVFSLQPELLYSRQGFEVNYGILGANYTAEYQLDYINLPVLAKFYLAEGFSIEAGPQFGLKINENVDFNTANNNDGFETNEVNDFDTSFAVGVTFQFNGGLFINGRYTYSFNEVIKDSDARHAVMQVGLGLRF